MDIVAKVVAIHQALADAGLPHAIGGALALAWCIRNPRGTVGVDVNVFIAETDAALLRDGLPEPIALSPVDVSRLEEDGQARLFWGETPVDIFLNSVPMHDAAARRVRIESFGGAKLPFLSCLDTAIFKALFNRSKDWVDLEEMKAAATLDVAEVRSVLVEALGEDDERVATLDRLAATGRAFIR